jgi:hypothetical protein
MDDAAGGSSAYGRVLSDATSRLLSLTAALNPTLLTATTLMLLLPSPSRLMLGYWLGAMTISIASPSSAATS